MENTRMNFIYKITFKDRIKNNTPPYFYIGSKTNASYVDGCIIDNKTNRPYYGSSRYPDYLSFVNENTVCEILEQYEEISHTDLLDIERKYQKEVSVKTNPDYFNLDYACSTNRYENSNYASFKHKETGKCIRLERDHELVIAGVYVGVTSGNTLSKEHKENISKGITGDKNGFYGKSHKEETLKVISEKAKARLGSSHPRQKGVIINGVEYRGVRPAARALGINPNSIVSNIKKGIEGWSYANPSN